MEKGQDGAVEDGRMNGGDLGVIPNVDLLTSCQVGRRRKREESGGGGGGYIYIYILL